MRIKEVLLIFMLIKVSCCQIRFYSSPLTESDIYFYSHVKRLLELCFSDRLNPVVITEDLFNKIHNIPWEIIEPPTIIIDKNFESKEIQVFNPRYPTYVLSVSGSIQEWKSLLDKLKSTTTWSIQSFFFIVEAENFCGNANDVLKLLWKMDLLSSFYLCRESDSGDLIIYSYNPFTSYAPHPWKRAKTTDQEIAGKETLFYKNFYNDRKVCHNITFDKTKTLGGHEIKTAFFTGGLKIIIPQNRKMSTLDSLFKLLNVTPSRDDIHPGAAVDALKNGYLKTLASGNYDIDERKWPIENINYKYTDILTHYSEISYSILTQERTFLTITSQMVSEHNYEILVFSTIVILSVFIFILIHNNFAFGVALLDVLSLIFNMEIMTPLGRLSMRITFIIGTFFIFSASSAIQNEISAFLAGPSRYHIDTLQNLFDNRYHVFYYEQLDQHILNQNIWVTDDDKKFLHPCSYSKFYQCVENLHKNSTIACIWPNKFQLPFLRKYTNLYLSKNPVFIKLNVPWVRKNWALKKKFDKIGKRVIESGFINNEDKISIINPLKKIIEKERIETSAQIDEVTETDLIPTYKIFGVCLIVALLIFCVEVIRARIFSRPRTNKTQSQSKVEPQMVPSNKRRRAIRKKKRGRNRRS